MTRNRSNSSSFEAATGDFADGLARIARLYGVSPLAGRLYAVLFASVAPLSLEELAGRCDAAKSSVSVALRGLARAQVVRRLPPRGDRKDYYEAITDPWQILADWNRLYFEPEIATFRAAGTAIEAALDGADDAPRGDDAAELRRRVAQIRDFAEVFSAMFDELDATRPARPRARAIAIRIDEEGDE